MIFIFDWNGTLIDDAPYVREARRNVFAYAGVAAPSDDSYHEELKKVSGFMEFYHKHGVPLDWGKDKVKIFYGPHYLTHLKDIEPFPGVFEALGAVRAAVCANDETSLRLMTVNRVEFVEPLLAKFPFREYFGENIHYGVDNKGEAIADFCKEHNLSHELACLVTDEPADVRHANAAGIFSVAFLSGHISERHFIGDAEPLSKVRSFGEFRDRLPEIIERMYYKKTYGKEFAGE